MDGRDSDDDDEQEEDTPEGDLTLINLIQPHFHLDDIHSTPLFPSFQHHTRFIDLISQTQGLQDMPSPTARAHSFTYPISHTLIDSSEEPQ